MGADAQGNGVLWLFNGDAIPDAEGESLTVDLSGTYSVVAIGASGCVSEPSNVILVDVLAVPDAPAITASSDISFCEGGMVTLVAGSDDGVSFLWNTGSTANELDVTDSGSYSVEAIANNGCSSVSSEAVEVTVHELPEVPTITELDGVLQASGTGSFQWSCWCV